MIKNFTAAVPNYNNQIRKIAGEQPAYFRTHKFNNLLKNCQKLLLQLIGCKNGKVVFLTASGTGAMDATISNLITKQDKLLIINGGDFGQRWVDICSYYHLNYVGFNVEFGKNIDLVGLNQVIFTNKPNIILVQHNETSAMHLHPIKKIGALCKKHNINLIVDAISSFIIDEYQMDNWNVYATVLSTNKGIGTYPGLSIVVLSKKVKLRQSTNYYFNYNNYLNNNKDMSLPFTPNIIALKQLHYQLNFFKKIGLKSRIAEIRTRALYFRELIKDLPFKIIAQNPSNCGTALYTERTDVKDLFERLQKDNIYFTPSGGKEGKKFIISHIGEQSLKDIKIIVNELRKWLKK